MFPISGYDLIAIAKGWGRENDDAFAWNEFGRHGGVGCAAKLATCRALPSRLIETAAREGAVRW
jgi:hypothetical protein